MENQFANILSGKVVIAGIGNTLRGDDGLGPALIERLRENINATCLDVGTSPESYAGKITKENPDVILLVDAVSLDRPPGTYEILGKNDILKCGLSTHDISPKMFIEYLESQTEAHIYMLGIQPQNISIGDEMSENVKEALKQVERLIKEATSA